MSRKESLRASIHRFGGRCGYSRKRDAFKLLDGIPETLTIDKSGASLAWPNAFNADYEVPIKIRQSKCLNNAVEQYRRAIKIHRKTEMP